MTIKTFLTRSVITIGFMFLAYALVTYVISLFCGSLLYLMKNPVNAIIIVFNIMALGCMFNMLYNKFKN